MDGIIVERQKLIAAVDALPDEALRELASFLDYLHDKSVRRRNSDNNAANFLIAVTGLGNSGQQDVSTRDEEILGSEIDPIYGWSSKLSDRP